jgi:hypothetical protein
MRLWISTTLFSERVAKSRWSAIGLIVAIAISLRVTPELVAFPHAVGYDTINYYIPVLTNLEQHWQSISDDFPLFILILYAVKAVTGLSAHTVVTGSAVALFGVFAVAVFSISRTLLKLAQWQSIVVTIFVVVQLAVLRTAWDLHRDLFSLSILLFIFSLLGSKERFRGTLALLVVLCCLTVALDRMVGLLLLISLVTGAIFTRNKRMTFLAAVSGGLFVILLVASSAGTLESPETASTSANSDPPMPSGLDYLVLFAVLNGSIAIPAILGVLRTNQLLLKVPLIVSGLGSFSWMVLSEPAMLVPERWVIMFGVFASLFAGYFILKIVQSHKRRNPIIASVLVTFGAIGIMYAVLPYDQPLPLLAFTKYYIEQFMPVTMQFNALDVRDNERLLAAIKEINRNTEDDAIIVGAKHWRGFMNLYLEDGRVYKFSENPVNLAAAHARLGGNVYLIQPEEGTSAFVTSKIEDSGRR